MKAEINNENKAKFFAQYWGQEVVAHEFISAGENAVVGSVIFRNLDNWYTELKSLSSISDEDAIEVTKMLGCTKGNSKDFMIGYGKDYVIRNIYAMQSDIADSLRDRGYLVPSMGLSCEELIEAGWAKYKE